MKISLLCYDLSHNCLGRTYILAKVLKRRFEVEIIGPLFGDKIWPPCDTGEFEYKFVYGSRYLRFISGIKKLVSLISGDVIYANKMQPTSLGVGLIKKSFSRKPLVLDVDDWEVAFCQGGKNDWLNPLGCGWVKMMEKFVSRANEITTVSSALNKRFGNRGFIVPHGRDHNEFDPLKFSQAQSKEKWNLVGYKVVMFLGSVRPHKGLEDLITAVNILKDDKIRIVIVDDENDNNYLKNLHDQNPNFLNVVGYQPFSEIPSLLSAADLVVLPQREDPKTQGQIPAKIFDAMSMAKPIISTRVSDLPQIIKDCGWVIPPSNPLELSQTMKYVFDHSLEAFEKGQRAREKMMKEYSFDKMEEVLLGVFSKYSKN